MGLQDPAFTNGQPTVLPCAPIGDIHTFLRGIEPTFDAVLTRKISEEFENARKAIVDKITPMYTAGSKKCAEILAYCEQTLFGMKNNFLMTMQNQRTNYPQPVSGAIEIMQKEELANMAEKLVNMVSFRKRISVADDTVGGPIDVAIITKGDGFIWIKHKHYFDPALNHKFFTNYYMPSDPRSAEPPAPPTATP